MNAAREADAFREFILSGHHDVLVDFFLKHFQHHLFRFLKKKKETFKHFRSLAGT